MFSLTIVTPERILYEGEVRSLVAPGSDGYFGVLSNHAPLISALKPGCLELRDAEDKRSLMAVSGGFIEVSHNKATLLVDAAEFKAEIDVERARSALERARKRLLEGQNRDSRISTARAQAGLARAFNRLNVSDME